HPKTYPKCLFFPLFFPFYSCEFQFSVSYRETHKNAVRFHFVIRQSLGAIGERLYLHCNVTICRRKDAPEPTIFNCFTHGEYCPNKTAELITKGPFVVWPFITKEERDKLKKQSSARPRIFFPFTPTVFQSLPSQGNENQDLFADSNRAFAVAGFLPLGLLIVVMIIVCFHITRLRRKAKRLVRLEPPCEEFETQADAEESNANTRETRL
ncbi:uncharacterized protein, partial [Acropora muricata]|uniref:uncharacterized protein n=1 Tax=Acropora muricata TaxID=159855 RepID=UPI0034E425B2